MLSAVDNVAGWLGPWRALPAGVLAAVATFLAARPICALGRRMRILDRPGIRSSHTTPVPRTGGLAILVGMGVALAVLAGVAPLYLPALALLIAAVSFADDVRGLTFASRLLVQCLVTASAVALARLGLGDLHLPYLPAPLPAWLGAALAVLFVVSFTNFFNFMDGINGIAASQGLWGGLALSILMAARGSPNGALAAAALAGACAGFLPHNFPRARMFMGDVGSATIGFTLALLTLAAARDAALPWVACILPLGVFLYDATFTLLKRILRGQNVVKPHREHHYQLLIRCGWSHARVTCLQTVLMLICFAAGLVYAAAGEAARLAVLAAVVGILAGYSVFVHLYFRRRRLDEFPVDRAAGGRASQRAEALQTSASTARYVSASRRRLKCSRTYR